MNDISIKKQLGKGTGYKHSDATKLKISEHHAKYWSGKHHTKESNEKRHNTLSGEGCYWYGKSIPSEVKNRMSLSHKGIRPSLETKRKISQTLRGKKKPTHLDRNIVLEYDEKHHYDLNNNLKQRDCERQKKIIDRIKPSLFLRYDENGKRLYDAITNMDFTPDILRKQLEGNKHEVIQS